MLISTVPYLASFPSASYVFVLNTLNSFQVIICILTYLDSPVSR